MKLRKPPYPQIEGTAVYYRVHTGHRRAAIDMIIGIIKEHVEREIAIALPDPWMDEMTPVLRDWAIETLIQGAWMREYHAWERDTKAYFDGNYLRNGGEKVNWRAINASHVQRVREQLSLFSAEMPDEIIDYINQTRGRLNTVKHQEEDFVTEADYQILVDTISKFWEILATQEQFTPPVHLG